ATVGRLAAGVAHEIGNPLTAVLGYVELLLADGRDDGALDLLQRIKAETGRIHRIVHDLLDYARPAVEAVEPVALAEVVATAPSSCSSPTPGRASPPPIASASSTPSTPPRSPARGRASASPSAARSCKRSAARSSSSRRRRAPRSASSSRAGIAAESARRI